MMNKKNIFAIILVITSCSSAPSSRKVACSHVVSGRFIVDENTGIVGIYEMGKKYVQHAEFGAPDVIEEDYRDKIMYYEFREEGFSLSSDETDTIKGITFHTNTGTEEKYHHRGLIWRNPSSTFCTFDGKTKEGLALHDKLRAEEVYEIYGTPKTTTQDVSTIQQLVKNREDHIYNHGKAGYYIRYYKPRMTVYVFDNYVEYISISSD